MTNKVILLILLLGLVIAPPAEAGIEEIIYFFYGNQLSDFFNSITGYPILPPPEGTEICDNAIDDDRDTFVDCDDSEASAGCVSDVVAAVSDSICDAVSGEDVA